jgi:hypothetical protein
MKYKISFIIKLINIIKAIFWKNSDVIYVNSNKKIFDQNGIDEIHSIKKSKFIINESKVSKLGLKFNKVHLKKMKIDLYHISRNLQYKPRIGYAGYASTPFAIYDGYYLGDNHDYVLFDTKKESSGFYKIDFSRKRISKNTITIPNDVDEICLLVSSSYIINKETVKSCYTYEYNNIIIDKITLEYLNKTFYFISDFLDECRNKDIKIIHLYSSSRQPVSFIIGTAIQAHHPEVMAYEFENGNYNWALDVQKGILNEG